MDSIGKQSVTGVVWSSVERFSIKGLQFLLQIIMARLLLPSDYGIVGMLAIFLSVSNVFIDSGFSNALIRKKDVSHKDLCTVFYYNLALSILLYILLYFSGPLVAAFYNIPLLDDVLKFMAITLVVNSLGTTCRVLLVKKVDFKTQTKITFSSALISGLIGIYLAYHDAGVWALCWQALISSILNVLLNFFYVRWFPTLTFSWASFKEMFKFGSNLLVSSLISIIYNNLYIIVIGKKYSSQDLGLYSRAEQFAMFPSHNLVSIVSRVTFPIFSKIQDDNQRLTSSYRLTIKYVSLIIFPLMLLLAVLAKPLILVVLTDKWVGTTLLLQLLCFVWMIDHLCVLNLNVLYVKGRSDLVLKLEIIKKTIAVIILICTLKYGLVIMCLGRVVNSIIATYINCYYTKKMLSLSFLRQVKDVFPFFITAFAMAIIAYISTTIFDSNIWKLAIGTIVGISLYSLSVKIWFSDLVGKVIKLYRK